MGHQKATLPQEGGFFWARAGCRRLGKINPLALIRAIISGRDRLSSGEPSGEHGRFMSKHDSDQVIDRARYRRITRFFARVIFHLAWWDIFLGRFPLVRGYVRRSRPDRLRQLSRRFRGLAVEMGGVMIKLGQFLSSRVDVLPPEITSELQGLQDEVPPEPAEAIQAVLQAELGDLSARFSEIESTPMAAASLGQTHRAWLCDGARANGRGPAVAVKIQRPQIEALVRTDLAALRAVAPWIMRYRPVRRRANVPALMDEFARTLWEELDYLSEADNAERFGRMFATDSNVYIPRVFREHSTGRVLTLENVEAIKITDMAAMTAANIDSAKVAATLFDAYFRQVFQEGFFHADPHPGNFFVRPREQVDDRRANGSRPFELIFVDFGMVGRIPQPMADNLRRVLVSVTRRDARGLTEAYNDLGFFLPGTDLERITEAQARVLNQIWGRKLLDLSRPDPAEVQEIGQEFKDILFDFPFQLPQDFIYLGRAIGMLSGLVSQLDPQINPWYVIERYGRQLMDDDRVGEFGWELLREWLRPFILLPARLDRLMTAVEEGRFVLQTNLERQTMRRLDSLEQRVGQLKWGLLAGAAWLSGTLFYVNGNSELGVASWIAAGLLSLWMLWGK
jgi:predicted unusual protein kinase regulating ubiquinone biosynthesis (AarF/ABC1/UbiB family)